LDSESGQSLANSEEKKFDKEHGIKTIPRRHATRDKLVIKVQDSGIGIKRQDRIKLFRLFGKLQNTRGMNTQGIGLGLVISDNIVEQFSGRIGCKSRYNHGSTFMFSILLGMDEDYIDKTKVNETIKIGDPMAERLNPPFVSNEEEMSFK
jgi:signal transduction histidine kinase